MNTCLSWEANSHSHTQVVPCFLDTEVALPHSQYPIIGTYHQPNHAIHIYTLIWTLLNSKQLNWFKYKKIRERKCKGNGFHLTSDITDNKYSSALHRTFYFILFHFIYFIYVGSILRTAGCISQSNKQEGQITCHSYSNSKCWSCRKLLLGESRKCWLWLRSVVWFCKATRESLCWTFGNNRHLGEQRRSKIYKMWALLLIVVPGKRG